MADLRRSLIGGTAGNFERINMNGKQSKRLRKVVRRELRNDWRALFNAACEQPARDRMKLAWRMVRGRKY